jgi:hypothetical protein
MGVSHFQVSEVPKSEKVFSLGSKSLENFSDGRWDGPGSHAAPPTGVKYFIRGLATRYSSSSQGNHTQLMNFECRSSKNFKRSPWPPKVGPTHETSTFRKRTFKYFWKLTEVPWEYFQPSKIFLRRSVSTQVLKFSVFVTPGSKSA